MSDSNLEILDGVLAGVVCAESSTFADALNAVFEQVRVEPITYDDRLIDPQQTDRLSFACG